jgi:hypothetical protein
MDNTTITPAADNTPLPLTPEVHALRSGVLELLRVVALRAQAKGWAIAGAFGSATAVRVNVSTSVEGDRSSRWMAAYRVAVPRTFNDGRPAPIELLADVLLRGAEELGGVTIYEATGLCASAGGLELDVFFELEFWSNDDARVEAFAKDVARVLGQREVMIRELAHRVRRVQGYAVETATPGAEPISAE